MSYNFCVYFIYTNINYYYYYYYFIQYLFEEGSLTCLMLVLHCRWLHCECHALRFQYTRQYSLCEQLNDYPTRTKCCICTYVCLSLSLFLSQ